MKKRFSCLMTCLACACCVASAQTVVEGFVKTPEGKPIEAYMTVKAKGAETIAAFGDVDAKGHYRMEVGIQADSIVLTANGIAFGNLSKTVANRSARIDFTVEERALDLKEVAVKAPKIRQIGDTLNYSVASYIGQGDRVIGDVLKKMPGIEVTNDGSIKYNGKAISQFYVEDMNLLQGRYSIATNNISAKDVATVQVLENHQPMKVLQGKTISENVAINLKLKDSAKNTLAVSAMLGAGTGPVWAAELVAMFFGKKRQDISLYKGNNAGDDISGEIKPMLSANGVTLVPLHPANIVMPSAPDIPLKRYWDNRSHVVSINHLEKPNKQTEVNLNVGYYDDDIRQEGETEESLYVTEEERLSVRQVMTGKSHLHNLSASARYCRNADDGFVADVLDFKTGWSKDWATIAGSENVNQAFNRPEMSIRNVTNIVKNIGRDTWNVHLSAGYAQKPNTLEVTTDEAAYVQEVDAKHIAANANTSYTIHLKNFDMDYGIIGYMSLHNVETDLSGESFNAVWYNTYELTLGQNYTWKKRDWYANLNLPIVLDRKSLNDRIAEDSQGYLYLLAHPNFQLTYEHLNWALAGNVSYHKQVGDYGTLYRNYIMTNYRSFQRSFLQEMAQTENFTTSATVRYRSALKALFGNITASRAHIHENVTYGMTYEGLTSIVHSLPRPTSTDNYSISGDVSKGFDVWQASVKAFGNCQLSMSERLVQDRVVSVRGRSLMFGLGGTVTPLPFLNIVYSGGFRQGRSYAKGAEATAKLVRSSSQRLSLNIFPTKLLTLTAALEDSYNNLTDGNRHAWFGDIKAKYKLKGVDLELELNNLFNQKVYDRVNVTDLDIYRSSWQLRPRNILLKVRFKLL